MTLQRVRIGEALSERWAHRQVSEGWKLRARCRGENPVLWDPAPDGYRRNSPVIRAATSTAVGICADCPVRSDCLAYALALDLRQGIWGGLTERQRARLTGRRAGHG